jgi:lycopene beta-cyclase
MTYFQSLLIFLGPVLVILTTLVIRRGIANVRNMAGLLLNVGLALVYTTPWDNYLVATQVWWYNASQVTGITLGYVPLEEYTFFVVQTLTTGLFLLVIFDHTGELSKEVKPNGRLRVWTSIVIGIIGLISACVLLVNWMPGRYAALILAWASFPLVIQLAFGADILWGRRRTLLLTIIPITLYLWLMDALSIGAGIWTIDPMQTTGIMVGNLPIEEMLFFLVTNILVSFGLTLFIAPESIGRLNRMFQLQKEIA